MPDSTCPCGAPMVEAVLVSGAQPVRFCPVCRPNNEEPWFSPLDRKVVRAVAKAAGISLDRCLGFSLQFREPALVVAVAEYHVPAAAFAAAVTAIGALDPAK